MTLLAEYMWIDPGPGFNHIMALSFGNIDNSAVDDFLYARYYGTTP